MKFLTALRKKGHYTSTPPCIRTHAHRSLDPKIVVMERSRSYLVLILFTSLSYSVAHESKYDACSILIYDPQLAPCMLEHVARFVYKLMDGSCMARHNCKLHIQSYSGVPACFMHIEAVAPAPFQSISLLWWH